MKRTDAPLLRVATFRALSLSVGDTGGKRTADLIALQSSRHGHLEFHRRGACAVRRSRTGQNIQPRRGGYDIVITVTGPRQTLVTFRKARVLGIWVNTESRVFENVPAYLAVLSNRPLDDITNAETLRRLQLGLGNFPLPQRASVDIADASQDDPFRVAFLKLKQDQGLYREVSNGVIPLTSLLFRAPIPLPAEVPVGNYGVDVRLFVDGAQIAREQSPFEVYKSGFEQVVTAAARDYGLLYGLATAMMAILTGWFASVVFRRD